MGNTIIQKFLVILLGVFMLLMGASCSQRESLDELGGALVLELEKLPVRLDRLNKASGEESIAIEIAELQMLSEAVRSLNERAVEAKPMSRDVQLRVSKQIRDIQGEVEYLMLQMQNKPALVVQCTREIELIAEQVHQLETRMKAKD